MKKERIFIILLLIRSARYEMLRHDYNETINRLSYCVVQQIL